MSSWNAQPVGFQIPDRFGIDAENEQPLRDELWTHVVRGDLDDLPFIVGDFAPELDATQRRDLAQLFVDVRRAQQHEFGPVESRLTAAFNELAARSIVARQDFTCCQTCLHAEIENEIPDTGRWEGYVAFHQQDTESLILDGEVYLAYGVFAAAYLSLELWESMPEQTQAEWYAKMTASLVRERVIPVLERHGMQVVWDGDLHERILVKNADFYVPLPSGELPEPIPDETEDARDYGTVLLADKPQFVRNEYEAWEGYLFAANRHDPNMVFAVLFPLDETGAVRVCWCGQPAYEAIVDVRATDDGEMLVLLNEQGAETLGLPEGIYFSLPGTDLSPLANEIQRRLIAVNAIADKPGTGDSLRYASEDGIENLLIAESAYGPVVFARKLAPTIEELDGGEGYVGVGNENGVMLGAINKWQFTASGTILLEIHPDAASELDLPERMEFALSPRSDNRVAYERVLAMLRASGEADAAGRITEIH